MNAAHPGESHQMSLDRQERAALQTIEEHLMTDLTEGDLEAFNGLSCESFDHLSSLLPPVTSDVAGSSGYADEDRVHLSTGSEEMGYKKRGRKFQYSQKQRDFSQRVIELKDREKMIIEYGSRGEVDRLTMEKIEPRFRARMWTENVQKHERALLRRIVSKVRESPDMERHRISKHDRKVLARIGPKMRDILNVAKSGTFDDAVAFAKDVLRKGAADATETRAPTRSKRMTSNKSESRSKSKVASQGNSKRKGKNIAQERK
ncbi:hypothetical protein CBS101457_002837 [Exobasidium rhododendri]|nr:hypothetical protein CBS101457_002837 [Exobasidium rhododendri]